MKAKLFLLVVVLATSLARGDDDFDKAFSTPTPTPPPQFDITGRVLYKLSRGMYLVIVDGECWDAKKHGIDDALILLRGEPAERNGDDIDTFVLPDGNYTYETQTGAKKTVPAFKVTPEPPEQPKLSREQQIFGPNSKMQGSALGH